MTMTIKTSPLLLLSLIMTILISAAALTNVAEDEEPKNVYGEPLKSCSSPGMVSGG